LAGHAASMVHMTNSHTTLVGKNVRMRPLGRLRYSWKINIKVNLREGSCGLDASGSEEGPVAGSCDSGKESSGSIKGGEFLY